MAAREDALHGIQQGESRWTGSSSSPPPRPSCLSTASRVLGIAIFGESLTIARIGCIALIVSGILGLKLFGGESAT